MIFQIPTLQQVDLDVMGMIHKQRQELRYMVGQNTVRWTGSLRRNTFARAVQGSNSIEGYNANLADAVEIIDDEKPENVTEETVRALVGYRNAMTYILRIHDDPHSEINEQFIRSLHFMMLSYDMTKLPGQWRRGPVYVVRDGNKEMVYEGPESGKVPELVSPPNRPAAIAAADVVLPIPISPTTSRSAVTSTASQPAARAATNAASVMAGAVVKSAVGRSRSSARTSNLAPKVAAS